MDTQHCIEICNKLLRDELSALETYGQAISKFPEESETPTLESIRQEHNQNAEVLKQHIIQMGGSPTRESGAWGSLAKAVEGSSKLLGKDAAVSALLQGEKMGKQDYEKALEEDDMMPEHKEDIRGKLLPRQERHISTLQHLTS